MGLDLYEELKQLVASLDAAGADYALVGALALAVHGVPRATTDIDLLVPAAAVDTALGVARDRGFVVEAEPLRFPDGTVLHRANLSRGEESLTLDLIVVDDNLAPAWASRARIATEDGPLSVVSREGLVRMKAAAGRPQDLADIARLEEADR